MGKNVSKFNVGDRIFARVEDSRIGTFSTFISIKEDHASLAPSNISDAEAASLPLVGLTSWQSLVDIVKLKPNQKVLIHAGSGGVGTFAIQLAKHLGADHIINYRHENFEERVQDMDAVFDTLGGGTLLRSFQVVKKGGWIVSVSGLPDHKTASDMKLGLLKTLILAFVGLRLNLRAKKFGIKYRFVFMKPRGFQLKQIADLVTKGIIKPVVDRVFPLDQIQEAIDYSESGHAKGKIVIRI